MATYTKAITKSNINFYTISVTASISSQTAATAKVSWSSKIVFGGDWYQWGVRLKTYINGEEVKSIAGACTSVGQTVCSASGTYSVSKTDTQTSIAIKAVSSSETVNGYGGVGSSYVGTASGNLTCKAPNTYTYKIAYNANGGSGTMATSTFKYGTSTKTTANAFTRTGYTFTGWRAHRQYDDKWAYSSDGVSTSGGWYVKDGQPSGWSYILYKNQNSWSKGSAVQDDVITQYAQWRANKLNVRYNANGGSLASDSSYTLDSNKTINNSSGIYQQVWTYNSAQTNGLVNISTFKLTRPGYSFVGWGTSSTATSGFGQDDTSLVPTSISSNIKNGDTTVTLYAIWKPNGTVRISNGSSFDLYIPYIYNGSDWEPYLAYIYDGSNWVLNG